MNIIHNTDIISIACCLCSTQNYEQRETKRYQPLVTLWHHILTTWWPPELSLYDISKPLRIYVYLFWGNCSLQLTFSQNIYMIKVGLIWISTLFTKYIVIVYCMSAMGKHCTIQTTTKHKLDVSHSAVCDYNLK